MTQVIECLPRNHPLQIKKKKNRGLGPGAIAQMVNACLACIRSWGSSPSTKKKKKKKDNNNKKS
jgi:hypothetical protein